MKFAVNVYGRDIICESCTDALSSRETYDWLSRVLPEKYINDNFYVSYIDIDKDLNLSDFDEHIIEQIDDDELFYPLVVINDEIIQHGNVQIEPITKWIDLKLETSAG